MFVLTPPVIFSSQKEHYKVKTLGKSIKKIFPMPDTWTQEICKENPSFLVSSDWLEMMLTSYYLFIEGAGDPDVQVRRQGEGEYSSDFTFRS